MALSSGNVTATVLSGERPCGQVKERCGAPRERRGWGQEWMTRVRERQTRVVGAPNGTLRAEREVRGVWHRECHGGVARGRVPT